MGVEPMLRRLLTEDIEMVVYFPQERCPVMADPSQLKQVPINLAVNAGDAMTKGGTFTIDVRTVEIVEGDQQHASMKPVTCEMLTVSDTGSGIDAETLAHTFEPLFTTKPVGEGTGLGLATVYGIARQSGGDVSVSSRPREGSTFKVYLPRSSDAIASKVVVERNLQRLAGTETVLLVDDSAPLRKMIMEVLSRKGYSVMEAVDGIQAWELSKNYTGVIHLLITDVVMPRMGGTQLAEHIMQERPDIAVIFLSGHAADKYPMPKHARGRITAIEKPCAVYMLLQGVRRVLDEPKDHAYQTQRP